MLELVDFRLSSNECSGLGQNANQFKKNYFVPLSLIQRMNFSKLDNFVSYGSIFKI